MNMTDKGLEEPNRTEVGVYILIKICDLALKTISVSSIV